jgi:hypothetical protein
MSNRLRCLLEPKPNPYPIISDTLPSKWGSISILILDEDLNQQELLMTQWDLATLIRWFAENENFLRFTPSESGEIDLCTLPFESLAQASNRSLERKFLEGQEEIEDQWFDSLFG